jgi:hypothetical protein
MKDGVSHEQDQQKDLQRVEVMVETMPVLAAA